MTPLRIWCVQAWCFPYRSFDAGKWSTDWPWHIFDQRHSNTEARESAIIAEWDAKHGKSLGAV